MLTVLHIFSGDLWAGAEVMVFNLLSELKRSPSIKVIALALNEGVLVNKLREINIETHVIPESDFTFPGIALKATRLVKKSGINVVHSHRYKENLLALILSKTLKVKCLVTTLHGMPEGITDQGKRENKVNFVTKLNFFMLRYYFNQVVAVSNEMRELLVSIYKIRKDKVKVIYNGIPITKSTNKLIRRSPETNYHIGTVGRMVPVKNLVLFIETAAKIYEKARNVRFSILGDGPLREKLIEKACELKINKVIDFPPTREDPKSYYQDLDLYMNTSLHEGIPLSILEAMLYQKPVIAPKTGGIPEIIENGVSGILIAEYNTQKYADACFDLIENKETRLKLAHNAYQKIVSTFSEKKMAESYMQLYNNCISRTALQ